MAHRGSEATLDRHTRYNMKKIIDLTGQRFGRLTVSKLANHRDARGRVLWELDCDCGNKLTMIAATFKYGNTSSCGCLRREMVGDDHRTHGMSKTSTYSAWLAMRKRCNNVNCEDYPNYGGRGIKVCERWNSFENFLADMGGRPKGLSIDRIDTNGDYSPENCRWTDSKTQARNKRNSVIVSFNGTTKHIREFCDELGLNPATVFTRIGQQKWSIDRALSTPTGSLSNVLV
jgi:hypothetical protein